VVTCSELPTNEGSTIIYIAEQLASMIGANRAATNRALGELRESGGVEVRHRYSR
jgi:DNA-binding transcriptional regulator YhcF (GntR family)